MGRAVAAPRLLCLCQRQGLWQLHAQRRADEVRVLVLGQGQMGRSAAARLAQQGYALSTWRRDGQPLPPLLARADIVVNLLPLTASTRGLLDAAFFAALPAKASVVNLGRGAHVVEADLLAALDRGAGGHGPRLPADRLRRHGRHGPG